eukprot:TRINITY_DN3788_c0_g1_i10.p1 TRINITY_DN3788_c0_g1~~TRINITY_DN3788_c0_g1_i10.p1  ORF type:complete len:522 (-),score=26.03 TRINITY_DN3788_c0_g1_i10:56-1621(-)
MGPSLMIEVGDSSIEEIVLEGTVDSRFDCEMDFEYRGAEEVSGARESKAVAPTEHVEKVHAIRKEVGLHEGVNVIEDLDLNTSGHDCAQFITGFRIERDGKDVDLESCGKENVRCHYSGIEDKVTVVVDCRRSLLRDARIRLEVGNDLLPTQSKKRMALSTHLVDITLIYTQGEEYHRLSTTSSEIVSSGTLISVVLRNGSSAYVVFANNKDELEELEQIAYNSTAFEFAALKPSTDPLSVPNRAIKVKRLLDTKDADLSHHAHDAVIYGKEDPDKRRVLLPDSRDLYCTPSLTNLKLVCDTEVFVVMEPTTCTYSFTLDCYNAVTIIYCIHNLNKFTMQCSSDEEGCAIVGIYIRTTKCEMNIGEMSLKVVLTAKNISTPIPSNSYIHIYTDSSSYYDNGIFDFPTNMKVVYQAIIPIVNIRFSHFEIYAISSYIYWQSDYKVKAKSTYGFCVTPKYPIWENNVLEISLSSSMTFSDFSCSANILSLIHISEPTRLGMISYAVFCLKKKKKKKKKTKKKK